MKELYDDVCQKMSKLTTNSYSTSLSLGTRFLGPTVRQPIYAIYGFVRFADEIVDSFHNYNKQYLLDKFKSDTYEAIDHGISLNPILNSFQHAVREFNIDRELIDTFLESMEMDLHKTNYNQRFIWITLSGDRQTINMSEFMSKERRHKEASMSQVLNVTPGIPEKIPNGFQKNANSVGCCLTISFTRGGGIDIKFQNQKERDKWHEYLTKILCK